MSRRDVLQCVKSWVEGMLSVFHFFYDSADSIECHLLLFFQSFNQVLCERFCVAVLRLRLLSYCFFLPRLVAVRSARPMLLNGLIILDPTWFYECSWKWSCLKKLILFVWWSSFSIQSLRLLLCLVETLLILFGNLGTHLVMVFFHVTRVLGCCLLNRFYILFVLRLFYKFFVVLYLLRNLD